MFRRICGPFCTARSYGLSADLGLLVGRVMFGALMAAGHGWTKLSKFNEMAGQFADPLGIGQRPTLVLAVFAEFFCALFVMAGLLTRLAAIPLIGTMATAAFIFHRQDPFAVKEKALLFLAAWVMLLLTGAGRFSLDYLLTGRKPAIRA
jgi:putative oxidoreductase